MRICVIMVNYNNSLLSIDCCNSLISYQEGHELELIIVDNNSIDLEKKIISEYSKKHPNVSVVFSPSNLGYFPGMAKGLNLAYNMGQFDYIVLCNNDMIYDPSFLDILAKKNYEKAIFVVSPDIVTIDGRHQNPHFINKISTVRKLLYGIYFSGWPMAQAIHFLQKKCGMTRLDKNKPGYNREQYIYMGFGACFILTDEFVKKVRMIDTRSFLMGEEALLTIQVNKAGGRIYYDPSLKIKHLDSASFKRLPNKFSYDCMQKSYQLYKDYI